MALPPPGTPPGSPREPALGLGGAAAGLGIGGDLARRVDDVRGLVLGGAPHALELVGEPVGARGQLRIEPEEIPDKDIFKQIKLGVKAVSGGAFGASKESKDISKQAKTIAYHALLGRGVDWNTCNIKGVQFDFALGTLKIILLEGDPQTERICKFDLLKMSNEAGTPESFKAALKEINEMSRSIKGYDGRMIENVNVSNQRSAYHKITDASLAISSPATHLSSIALMNLERFAENGSVFVANKIQEVLGAPTRGASPDLASIYRDVKARRHHITAAINTRIDFKKSQLGMAGVPAETKEQISSEIARLEKMKAFFQVSQDDRLQNLADVKSAIAIYIKEYVGPRDLTAIEKKQLAEGLSQLFLQDKVNTWAQRFWMLKNQVLMGNIYGAGDSEQSREERKKSLEKSSNQVAFETVSLLYNSEVDTDESIIRESNVLLARELKAEITRKDASDVIYETISKRSAGLDVGSADLEELFKSFDLANLDQRDKDNVLNAFNEVIP